MVKRYTKNPVGAHYGTGDWVLQRLTAVVMAVYTLFAVGCLLMGGIASHAQLKAAFSGGFWRIFTMLFFAALLYHAWVGMRDILMDYVKPAGLRLALQAAVGLTLVAYLIWAASILWGAGA